MLLSGEVISAAKVPAKITPAEVMIAPVRATACWMPKRGSRSTSSRTRDMRKML